MRAARRSVGYLHSDSCGNMVRQFAGLDVLNSQTLSPNKVTEAAKQHFLHIIYLLSLPLIPSLPLHKHVSKNLLA